MSRLVLISSPDNDPTDSAQNEMAAGSQNHPAVLGGARHETTVLLVLLVLIEPLTDLYY